MEEEKIIIHLTGAHDPVTKALELNFSHGILVEEKIAKSFLENYIPKQHVKDFPNAKLMIFLQDEPYFDTKRAEAMWKLVENKTFCFDTSTNTNSILESIVQKWWNKKPSLVKIEDVLEAWNRLSPQEKLEAYGNVDRYFNSKKNKYIHNLHKWFQGKYFKTDKIMRDEITFG